MATASAVPLPTLNWDAADPSDAYIEWKDFMTSYFVISDIAEEKKWHYILLSAGQRGHELWKTWSLSDDDKKKPDTVFQKFEEHLVGTVNKWVMRLELSNMQQNEGESVDDFLCRLRAKANLCKFTDETTCDEMITFQLIKGIKWAEEKKELIKKGNNLKLTDAAQCARSYQAAIENTSSFTKGSTSTVNKVHTQGRPTRMIQNCYYCGRDHPRKQCPAWGSTCESCGKANHWSSQCEIATQQRRRGRSSQRKPQRNKSKDLQNQRKSRNKQSQTSERQRN